MSTEKRTRRPQSKGKCSFCGAIYTKSGIGKHLATCAKRITALQESSADPKLKSVKIFDLLVSGTYAADYWMYLEIPGKMTLQRLDQFLRDTWLECCGHLSRFTINNISYASYPMSEFDEKGLNILLEKVLEPGFKFQHEYDYGDTTDLTLSVLTVREIPVKGNTVRVIARNEMPIWDCDVCGGVATQICTECIYDDKGLLCDSCAAKHNTHEEMLLPVVNSPRVGQCGYTGEATDYA
jgi:hypothetical protein